MGALGFQRRRTQPGQDSAEGQKGAGCRASWCSHNNSLSDQVLCCFPQPLPPPGEKEESEVTVIFVLVIIKAWTSI